MEDGVEPDWRVVIRYESRSRRRVDENQSIFFGAGGATKEANLISAASIRSTDPAEGDEVEDVAVRAVDACGNLPADDAHFDDLQYEEEEDED
jgi:hypothetical protein